MNTFPQVRVRDADEPPGLHEADARCRMRGGQQPGQYVVGHHTRNEAAHVAAFADYPVDRSALRCAVRVLAHAGEHRWHHRGVARDDVLITALELEKRLADGDPVTILD